MRKYGLYIWLCMATLLCGCNQEDDVFEIFASGQTWHWSGSYDTTNWQDDNNYTLTNRTRRIVYVYRHMECRRK